MVDGQRRRRAADIQVVESITGDPGPQLVPGQALGKMKAHPCAPQSILYGRNRTSRGSNGCALLHGNAPPFVRPLRAVNANRTAATVIPECGRRDRSIFYLSVSKPSRQGIAL